MLVSTKWRQRESRAKPEALEVQFERSAEHSQHLASRTIVKLVHNTILALSKDSNTLQTFQKHTLSPFIHASSSALIRLWPRLYMHLACATLVTLRMHTPSMVAGIDHSYSVVFRITHQLPNSTRTGQGMRPPPVLEWVWEWGHHQYWNGSGNEATISTGMGLGMRLPPVEWVWEWDYHQWNGLENEATV